MECEKSPLLVIIPAFNEEQNIGHVIDDLERNCPQYDYLVINDGSSDRTAQLCRENGVPLLDLPINLGLAGAFQAGMRYAVRSGYQYALQFGADGQHCAEFVEPMLTCAQEHNRDIVIASRYIEGKKGMSIREIGSRMISVCIFLTTGKRIQDPTSGMRLYHLSVMEKLAHHMNYQPEPDTLAALLRDGATIEEIPATMNERLHGASYLSFANSIRYMFQVCMSILVVNWLR